MQIKITVSYHDLLINVLNVKIFQYGQLVRRQNNGNSIP